jgi:hypothetical protein
MKYVYVDYENMSSLKELPKIDGKYFIFIGENQQKIPREFVFTKENKELIEIKGNGKNALDFHIVYFLAKNDDNEDIEHYILSKDSGYDPIIAFCKDQKKIVKRIISIEEIIDRKKDINENTLKNLDVYLKHLKKIQKNRYPKSENGLTRDIGSALGKKLTNEEIEDVIQLMYMKTYIGKKGNNITYNLPN